MEINGLPLHALAVHAAVVFGPLAALAGLAYAVPRWRDRLRIPLLVVVLVAFGSIWVAYLSGESLLESNAFFEDGPLADLVKTHEDRAEVLRLVTTAYAGATVLAVWLHGRGGGVRIALTTLVVAGAVATGVLTVLTGDAGAQIAWNGING